MSRFPESDRGHDQTLAAEIKGPMKARRRVQSQLPTTCHGRKAGTLQFVLRPRTSEKGSELGTACPDRKAPRHLQRYLNFPSLGYMIHHPIISPTQERSLQQASLAPASTAACTFSCQFNNNATLLSSSRSQALQLDKRPRLWACRQSSAKLSPPTNQTQSCATNQTTDQGKQHLVSLGDA